MKPIALKLPLSLLALAGLCAACASAPKSAASAKPASPAAPASTLRLDEAHAPVMVGPDIISVLPPAAVWAVLSDADNWGAWNNKVTGVAHTAGLNVGADLSYRWEEKDVKATIEEVKEPELLVWKGARAGSDVRLRWTLGARDDGGTLVSLRAVLHPKSGPTPIANAGNETQAWMSALQDELGKRAAALPVATPVAKVKKKKKKAAAVPAAAAPAAVTRP